MMKTATTTVKEKLNLPKKQYRKNEILSCCSVCKSKRILAYWDEELEHYIYLADEPVLCFDCQFQSMRSFHPAKESTFQNQVV